MIKGQGEIMLLQLAIQTMYNIYVILFGSTEKYCQCILYM